MDIRINVTIGATPELESILKALLPKTGSSEQRTGSSEQRTASSEQRAASSEQEAGSSEQETGSSEQRTANSEVKYDAAYARKVMDETRKRIEGTDYKDDPDAPGRKKYHTQLTAVFKQIATQLGGTEKPSALDPEQMQKFAQECACIEIEGDKVVVNYQPF